MENELKVQEKAPVTFKGLMESNLVKNKITEMLGKNAPQFITSALNLASSNLKGCNPATIYGAVMKAAALNLPVDPNLGFAWIIPYSSKNGKEAQFQIGYKGFIQLAKRSGQYAKLNAIELYEGQLKSFDRLTEEIEIDWDNKQSDKIIGFVAYMKEIGGFEKTTFWTNEEMEHHAKKYSKNYAKYNSGLWKDDFVKMGQKTALKLMLSRWGTLSIEMQQAVASDQGVIKLNGDSEEIEYIDNKVIFP